MKNYAGILLTIVVSLVVAFLGCAAIVFLCEYFDIEISDESIVLTFVGILATFVVISNYSQVKEVESNTKTQVDKIQKTLKEKETEYIQKVNNLNNNINTMLEELELSKKSMQTLIENLKTKEYSYLRFQDVHNSLNELSACFSANKNYDMDFTSNIIRISLLNSNKQFHSINLLINKSKDNENSKYIKALENYAEKIIGKDEQHLGFVNTTFHPDTKEANT